MTTAKTLEILGTVERLSSDMLCRFDNLTQADWDAPSRCHMWSVKDAGLTWHKRLGFI